MPRPRPTAGDLSPEDELRARRADPAAYADLDATQDEHGTLHGLLIAFAMRRPLRWADLATARIAAAQALRRSRR